MACAKPTVDFDQIRLLADSGAVDRVRAGGFDGMAIYDNYVRPERWPKMACLSRRRSRVLVQYQCRLRRIAQRNVPPDSCYRPPNFEPPAILDWSTTLDHENARRLAEWRIDGRCGQR